jgi:hypothetical protein
VIEILTTMCGLSVNRETLKSLTIERIGFQYENDPAGVWRE